MGKKGTINYFFYYLLRFKKTDDKGHLKELYKGFPLLITVCLIFIIYL